MKKLLILLIVSVFATPTFVKASAVNNNSSFDESNAIIISQDTKFLKTVNEYANVERDSYGNISKADVLSSVTYELTEEEYYNSDFDNTTIETRSSTTIEANYRVMTSTLSYSNGTYRYKNQINWTTFPSVRGFDVIGIGHYSNVEADGTPYFLMEYITASGAHLTGLFHYDQSFSNGRSSTFNLPLQNLQSMTITLSFDVKKTDNNNTITSQVCAGDYAHGIDSSVTLSDALNHGVYGAAGIVHAGSVADKFDSVDEAEAYWFGTW